MLLTRSAMAWLSARLESSLGLTQVQSPPYFLPDFFFFLQNRFFLHLLCLSGVYAFTCSLLRTPHGDEEQQLAQEPRRSDLPLHFFTATVNKPIAGSTREWRDTHPRPDPRGTNGEFAGILQHRRGEGSVDGNATAYYACMPTFLRLQEARTQIWRCFLPAHATACLSFSTRNRSGRMVTRR